MELLAFPFRPFEKPVCRRKAVFYNMVRILLNCSFRALLRLYVISKIQLVFYYQCCVLIG